MQACAPCLPSADLKLRQCRWQQLGFAVCLSWHLISCRSCAVRARGFPFNALASFPRPDIKGEMAIRIDENIDDTLSNVTSAQAQLLKYLNTISSNRWLVLKVFGVLLFFLIFFIMFIV
ncbi:hypothetical protein DUNSADRAFT_18004 [Dunaliella salina]|uniref:t-SNARE coiled-coil homology domain-containing protein n=1 Tax=Dunaliella salina TaxID=3046 RepID=A0ABQ7G0V1_DUNSA|nr:hypothetical protein DUNSADRAFT_18004 [Dunaliella salina]|eukprot:KAF5828235.1 hypothetical protein DUNSADRAFT_18004 [Dunaliella salina]